MLHRSCVKASSAHFTVRLASIRQAHDSFDSAPVALTDDVVSRGGQTVKRRHGQEVAWLPAAWADLAITK